MVSKMATVFGVVNKVIHINKFLMKWVALGDSDSILSAVEATPGNI